MPLNKKGKKIMNEMADEYGEKKGREIFYKSERKGTIKSVTKKKGSK